MSIIRKILEEFIIEDDEKRQTIKYNLTKLLDKTEKKLLNLKIKDLIKENK
jgi:hypothetical protein